MLVGGFRWCGCCGIRGWGGLVGVLDIRSWLSEMYLVLSVWNGRCGVHGFGQFSMHLG